MEGETALKKKKKNGGSQGVVFHLEKVTM